MHDKYSFTVLKKQSRDAFEIEKMIAFEKMHSFLSLSSFKWTDLLILPLNNVGKEDKQLIHCFLPYLPLFVVIF